MSEHKIRNWLKKNKGKIIAVCSFVAAAGGAAYLYHLLNQSDQAETTPELMIPQENSDLGLCEVTPLQRVESDQYITERIPHDVSEHLRTLPEGWHASPEKIATAQAHGYTLGPRETWVEAYRTGS